MAMPRRQVAQMWLGGFKSHLSAEALWVLMHIIETGASRQSVTLKNSSTKIESWSTRKSFDF